MFLTVNGQENSWDTLITLQGLTKYFGLKKDLVIAEVNGAIIKKDQWPAIELKDGDTIELIQYVGGGA